MSIEKYQGHSLPKYKSKFFSSYFSITVDYFMNAKTPNKHIC